VGPISIKLRCTSWAQLSTIYKRDLSRGSLFLRSPKPPPIGTEVKVDMTLPSESMIVLTGVIVEHVGEGGMDGRGPGVDIKLAAIPQSAMWLIETALASHKPSDRPGTAAIPVLAGTGPISTAVPGTTGVTPSGPLPSKRAPSIVDAGLDDSADLADAESELVTALGAELISLQKLNPFQVLGVGYEGGDAEVRAAFGELTRRYHPDRYAKYPSLELRRLAAEIFILIRDAYRKIDTDAGRHKELGVLGRSGVPRAVPSREGSKAHAAPPPVPPPRVPTAALPRIPGPPPPVPVAPPPAPVPPVPPLPVVPGRATPPFGTQALPADLKAPSPPPPVAPPTQATAVVPRTTQAFRPNLGGTDGKDLDSDALDALLDEGKYDEALALCRMASKKNPADRVARAGIELAEGMRALAGKDRMEAAQRFETVLELDPSNERAARELADMRRQATNERKGLLTRLLGKKE
jgi:hypothetical protein